MHASSAHRDPLRGIIEAGRGPPPRLIESQLLDTAPVDKAQLLQLCQYTPEALPPGFCTDLKSLSDEQVHERFLSSLIDQGLTLFLAEQQKGAQEVHKFLEESQATTLTSSVWRGGLLLALLALGLIFLSYGRDIKAGLYLSSSIIALNSLGFLLLGSFLRDVSPGQLLGLLQSATRDLLPPDTQPVVVKLAATLVVELLKAPASSLFVLALSVFIPSATLAAVLFLQRHASFLRGFFLTAEKQKPKKK